MTSQHSKSMLFLFSMQNAKMQRRNTGPYALQNRQICAFPTGESSRAGHNRISH
ncbi:unknown [Prevotella sp. CAG:255]|nr:unknown [Prevotella sp. CAG:255]